MIWFGLPPLLVAGAIFWLSSMSAGEVESAGFAQWLGPYGGEIAHGVEYLALGGLLTRALVAWGRIGPAAGGRWRQLVAPAVAAVVVSVLYGVSDEWHQTFVPGRVAELKDLAIDAAGAVVGAAAYAAARGAWRRPSASPAVWWRA